MFCFCFQRGPKAFPPSTFFNLNTPLTSDEDLGDRGGRDSKERLDHSFTTFPRTEIHSFRLSCRFPSYTERGVGKIELVGVIKPLLIKQQAVRVVLRTFLLGKEPSSLSLPDINRGPKSETTVGQPSSRDLVHITDFLEWKDLRSPRWKSPNKNIPTYFDSFSWGINRTGDRGYTSGLSVNDFTFTMDLVHIETKDVNPILFVFTLT